MTSTRENLIAFYREHNPVKLKDVDVILETFAGREEEMMEALFAKYNIDTKENVATKEIKKEHDFVINHQEKSNEGMNRIYKKRSIVNKSESNESPHDKMEKLIESMSAIDLILLEERISTLLHSEFDERTRHDVLWHTTRYLCYFLQCAQQFYTLACQNEREEKEGLKRCRGIQRNCIGVETEHAAHVESATQTNVCNQSKEEKQEQQLIEYLELGTQTELEKSEVDYEQTKEFKLKFDMAVNTSNTLNTSSMTAAIHHKSNNSRNSSNTTSFTHEHNYRGNDNTSEQYFCRQTIQNRHKEREQVHFDNNSEENKQSSRDTQSIIVDTTSNSNSYQNEPNVQRVKKRLNYKTGKEFTPVLRPPRCLITQHTTEHETHLIVDQREYKSERIPTRELQTITLTLSPPSEEKHSVIGLKLQEILPLSCNITLVLNPGVYYENLEFIAEMIMERQTQEVINVIETNNSRNGEINNKEHITINMTCALPGAMVIIKPCQTFAPALLIRGNVKIIIRSIMFVGYDNSIVNEITHELNLSHSEVNETEVAPLIYIGSGSYVLMEGCHVYSNSGGGVVMKCEDIDINNIITKTFESYAISEEPMLTELECRLCLFTKCGFAGLFALGNNDMAHSLCRVTCTHCEFTFCEVGLHIHNTLCTLHKCLVERCRNDGVVINGNGIYYNNNNNANMHLLGITQERITHSKTPVCALTWCVIAHNANNGVLIGLSAVVELVHCVIEENACYGIERFTGCTLHINKCVIRNNGIAPVSTSFDEIEESYEPSISDTTIISSKESNDEEENHLIHIEQNHENPVRVKF